MEEAYFRNLLNLIEEMLSDLPSPVYILEKPGNSVTSYFFHEPIRKDSMEEQSGKRLKRISSV